MTSSTLRVATRVALFTLMCLSFVFILVTVFGQFRFDPRDPYRAVFTNVSGLKGGNFVRVAGVEVGKIRTLTANRDGTVTVDFAVDKTMALTEGTRAVVRYENLIGDRYLSLEEGAGSVRRLTPGGHWERSCCTCHAWNPETPQHYRYRPDRKMFEGECSVCHGKRRKDYYERTGV